MSGFTIRYGKIEVAAGVLPMSIGPTSAFLPLDYPLPVGCDVELVVGDFRMPAKVLRAIEALKGRDADAGIWVCVPEFGDARGEVWSALVHCEDAAIPEAVGAQEAVDKAELSAGLEERLGAALDKAGPFDTGDVRRGDGHVELVDDGRMTQAMQAVDIEAVLAAEKAARDASAGAPGVEEPEPASQHDTDRQEAAPQQEIDPGMTQPMGSGGRDATGKRKKRRRRKTKSK